MFRFVTIAFTLLATGVFALPVQSAEARPNILFAIADDASWAHFGAYGDKVCRTPNIDRVAREGVLFSRAFCSSPSCTPSRGAILTGQNFWRLEDGANLWSHWPNKFQVYPDLLEKAGYKVGLKGKGWGPGNAQSANRTRNPAGPGARDFASFLKNVPADQPFCFWFGSSDPHRPYDRGSGERSGQNVADVTVPGFLPDTRAVRSDILDYYFEIERFDREVGEMIELIEKAGRLDNTIVVVTSDNGMPFPRAKANLYDYGARMPLMIRWPTRVKGARVIDDFVNHIDLAPTFLEAAGLKPLPEMTGRSLMPLLTSSQAGQIDPKRDRAHFGRERHANVRANNLGYPARAIRTADFLYIRNYEPDRWPAGDPPLFGDVDVHNNVDGSPTKQAVMEHGWKPEIGRLFDLGFGKRPAEELYGIATDPFQTNNIAALPKFADAKKHLQRELDRYLAETKDPRAEGKGDVFDRYPYFSPDRPARPSPNRPSPR